MTSRLVLWFVCVLPCFHGHPPLHGYSTAYTPFKLHTASLLVWWPCRRDESVGFVLRFTSLTLVFWPACANRSAPPPRTLFVQNTLIMDALIEYYYGLNYWSLESRFTEDGTFCTMRYVWQSLFMRLCFVTGFASLDHCMYCTGCDTDSLNRCQREALRYMQCTHTIAHSTVLSSALTAWLKVIV